MTDKEQEIFVLLYAGKQAVADKNWPEASVIWERLVEMYAPLATWYPDVAPVLHNKAVLVALAGRHTSRVH